MRKTKIFLYIPGTNDQEYIRFLEDELKKEKQRHDRTRMQLFRLQKGEKNDKRYGSK